jgi:catechol 2,3-dioxygenase-like lactoylglutathione lyase family enzyme
VLGFALIGFLHVTRGTAVRRVRGVSSDGMPIAVDAPEFPLMATMATGTSLQPGNLVEVLLNGDQTYSRLWEDLRSAKQSITLQLYYGAPGRMADALGETLLTRVFNMRQVRDCPHPDNPGTRVHVFEMGSGGPHAELHVAIQPDLPASRQGAGGVHHVAFRTPDANYDAWAERLNEFAIPNSGKVDRFWFRSLYVREPNGVLFEIATDGPGFAVDEDPATLGETVVLPPFLEAHRQHIVNNLKPIDG